MPPRQQLKARWLSLARGSGILPLPDYYGDFSKRSYLLSDLVGMDRMGQTWIHLQCGLRSVFPVCYR